MATLTRFFTVCLAFCIACSRQAPPSSVNDPDVLAEFGGGTVTREELDAAILELAPNQRLRKDMDPDDWYEKLVRKLAFDKILLEEARQTGADESARFQKARRNIERQVYTDFLIAQTLGEEPPITLGDVRAYYDANRNQFQRKASRLVYHIFKRFQQGIDKDSLTSQMEELRDRVLGGESFQLLAQQHSDSESRHRMGSLGFVTQGQLSPDLDRLVFSLEEQVPSEPVVTKDGVHLFYTEHNLPALAYDFDEVRLIILKRLEAESKAKKLAEMVASINLPEDNFVPNSETLTTIMNGGDDSAEVLRLGDFRLTLGELELLIANQDGAGTNAPQLHPWVLLQRIKNREIMFRHLQDRELPENAILRKRVDAACERELKQDHLHSKMVAHLENHPDILQNYYQNNRMRFSSQPRVHLVRLTKKIDKEAAETMGRLERLKQELDRKEIGIEDVARNLSMNIDDLGPLNPRQLAAIDPRAAQVAFSLQPGAHSFPYRTETELVLFKVVEKKDPEALPFSEVQDSVLKHYLANYSQKLYETFAGEALDRAGFRFYGDRLNRGLPGIPEFSNESPGEADETQTE